MKDKESGKKKRKSEEPEWKDYFAMFIALLETTFLPILIVAAIFTLIIIILVLFA
ncbi:MAG: hypothetical protein QXX95_04725 [Nitrososphaerales archaeon]